MAEELGCSRASVCARIQSLAEHYHLQIDRVRGQGYRLLTPIDWLDASAIQPGLPAGLRVEVVDETGSTNSDVLARAAQGEASGLVRLAEVQTAGRGRLGRRWQTPLGSGLTFSLLWRFDCGVGQLSGLSLLVGVALTRVLNRLGAPVRLKWPNDVLLGECKLAGILIELAGDALGPSAVVIGVGLNVRPAGDVGQPAAALSDAGLALSRNALAAALLSELADLLTQFAHAGFAPFQAEWEHWHAWQDEPVVLLPMQGEALAGIALGIDAHGALRLMTAYGEQAVHAGEISLRRHA
jgi:BirA family biotin operon repressor/biotin-[acetyl-CoA-carboxylase] ligase